MVLKEFLDIECCVNFLHHSAKGELDRFKACDSETTDMGVRRVQFLHTRDV